MKANKFWISFLACLLVIVLLGGIAIFAIPSLQTKLADSIVEKSQRYKETLVEKNELESQLTVKNQAIITLNETINENRQSIQQLNQTVVNKQTTIDELTTRKNELEIELNNSNSNLASVRMELNTVNNQLSLLQDDIVLLEDFIQQYQIENENLHLQIIDLQAQIDDLIRINQALQDDSDITVALDCIRYDLSLAGVMFYDYEHQSDQLYHTKNEMQQIAMSNNVGYQKCYWYRFNCKSLNITDSALKAVYYNTYSNTSKEIVFIDGITGEEITSLNDYLDYYSDIDGYEIKCDFSETAEIIAFSDSEIAQYGYYVNENTIPVKSIKLYLEIHPCFNLQTGVYTSDDGDVIDLRVNSRAVFNNDYGNYSKSGIYVYFYNFNNSEIVQNSYANIISNESFVWNDKVFVLTN